VRCHQKQFSQPASSNIDRSGHPLLRSSPAKPGLQLSTTIFTTANNPAMASSPGGTANTFHTQHIFFAQHDHVCVDNIIGAVDHRQVLPASENTSTHSSHVLLDKVFRVPHLLRNIVGYLPITAVLHLAVTSKDNRKLLCDTSGAFQCLDLSTIKSGQLSIGQIDQGGETWRNVQLDENVTEDEYVLKLFRPFLFCSL